MQYREGERTIRRMGIAKVECFECGEKGHKCRECPLWIRRKNEERVVHVAMPQKAQQKRRPARPVREEVQERKLRKVEQEETVIELSTRGTVHSDIWYLRLFDRAMARSYHLLDYG